jgi:LuxR family maltose regulon positive regulatory protein
VAALALTEAMCRWQEARCRGLETIEQNDLQDYTNGILVEALAARVAHRGGPHRAGSRAPRGRQPIRPQVMTSFPWLGVLGRLHAIRACIALHEWAAARTLLAEIDEIRHARPDLGALDAEADAVRTSLGSVRDVEAGPWALTNAEIRLLAYLPTHLTFREIAERMHLSPHTIKTQTMSIYGKLEASSRRAALERAVAGGLLDPSVLHFAEGPAGIA